MAKRNKSDPVGLPEEVTEQTETPPSNLSDVVAEARMREEKSRIRVAPEPMRVTRKPAPQDIIAPFVSAADMVAELPHRMAVARETRLRNLARSNRDVAKLLAERK